MNDYYQAMLDNYPNFEQCSIQTFDDTQEKRSSLARIFENKEDNLVEIQNLNDQNAGIFFSVNPMKPWKRDKSSVTGISAWICEIDWLEKGVQEKLIKLSPLKPSLVLESKSSYHMYWFAKDWSIENRNDICNGLRNFFDWDPAVVDISRVLRLPWYYHCKNPQDKFMIWIHDFHNVYYTEEDMMKAYPNKQSVSELKRLNNKKETEAKRDLWWDYFRDRVKEMDTMEVLGNISWTSFVNNETIDFQRNANGTYQIMIDGRSIGAWIDKNNKIGSYSWWWPNWTNWVFRYGNCNWSELARWIKDNYPEMCESKVVKKKEKKEITESMQDVDRSRKIPYTRWLPSLDRRFGKFDRWHFIVTVWESGSWKTEFTFFQARANADAGVKVCYIALEMTKQNMIDRLAMKHAGISKVQKNEWKVYDDQKVKFKEKRHELRYYKNLDIVHLEEPTLDVISEYILEKKKEWYELFYIDNLWFIVGDNREEEINLTARASRVIKELTNKHNITINLIHHFNKWSWKDRNWPRSLASIRSSWKIENDADFVIQVWRDMEEEQEGVLDKQVWIVLQKDREYWEPWKVIVEFDWWLYKDLPSRPF